MSISLHAPRALMSSSRGYQEIMLDCKFMTENREIFFTGAVNKESVNNLIAQLIYLERDRPGEEITIYIDSQGGDVDAGMAAVDCMSLITSPIRTVCFTAYSMGALLFLCGEKRVIMPSGRVMLHGPSYSGDMNVAGLKKEQIQVVYENLAKCNDRLVKIICEKTSKPKEIIDEIMKQDTYYNSDESVEFGIATEIAKKGVF